jgi:hypothetical protein
MYLKNRSWSTVFFKKKLFKKELDSVGVGVVQ